eukprot:2468295-Pleurochrysis_carterae.AAC.2
MVGDLRSDEWRLCIVDGLRILSDKAQTFLARWQKLLRAMRASERRKTERLPKCLFLEGV